MLHGRGPIMLACRACVLLGIALALCLSASLAAAQTQPPLVGWLGFRGEALDGRALAPFRQGLREVGLVEGESVMLVTRYADGDMAQLAALAAELVRAGARVIVAHNPPAVEAARHATSS